METKHFFSVTLNWIPTWIFNLLLHMRKSRPDESQSLEMSARFHSTIATSWKYYLSFKMNAIDDAFVSGTLFLFHHSSGLLQNSASAWNSSPPPSIGCLHYPLQLYINLHCMWILWYLLRGVYSFSTLPACWSRGVFSGCLKLHCPLASFACRFHCTPGSRAFRDGYT